MAQPAVRRAPSNDRDQSIGDLVSVAARDVSQLIRYEIDLAKLELKADVKRAGISAALLAVAVFSACLLLMVLCFAFAYGLNAIGAPGGLWGAFLYVAATVFLLIILAGLVVLLIVRRLAKMRKTRQTVAEDVGLLRHAKSAARTSVRVR
ncbi:MAG TPA: phage holin family protein [Streptosporangiaceae bacterium]|nr:phage holin family protein [Streptosporangiaceae bacterium]